MCCRAALRRPTYTSRPSVPMATRVSLCTALVLLSAACSPPPGPDSEVLIASGTGVIEVPPTVARASVSVETHASTPPLASDRNSTEAARVLGALRARADLDSVRVTDVGASPNQNDAGRLIDYQATTTIGFLVRNLDSVGAALHTAVLGGATGIDRVTFESDSSKAGRRKALALAFRQAKEDATTLAESSNQRLGPLVSVTSGQPWSTSMAFEEASIITGGSQAEFGYAQSGVIRIGPTPQAIRISATVTGRWRALP